MPILGREGRGWIAPPPVSATAESVQILEPLCLLHSTQAGHVDDELS